MTKTFIQTVDDAVLAELERIANKRHIKVQELLRAIVIPDFVQRNKLEEKIARSQIAQVA